MRPGARTLLVALATLTAILIAPAGIAASVADDRAQVSQMVANTVEHQMFGSELIGKVIKDGKVGNIDAKVGDVVLREVTVPHNSGARSTLGSTAVQETTVLHGEHIRTISPSDSLYDYRFVVAVQENQSKQVRAYAKGHLFGPAAIVATYHELALLRASNADYDSAGDGCGPVPSGIPCTYSKDPPNAEPPNAIKDYYALGMYRHKCGQEGWGCDNEWATLTQDWFWWDPSRFGTGAWVGVTDTCSYDWSVLYGQRALHCDDTP